MLACMKPTPSPFASIHHRDIANLLADVLYDVVRKNKTYQQVVEPINRLRHLIWQDFTANGHPAIAGIAPEVEKLLAGCTTPAQRTAALTLWLRLGQLYELAALVARANMIDQMRDPDVPRMPGGITDMVTTALGCGVNPLEALGRPVFEVVMTAHPTNVNDKETILAIRMLGMATDALRKPTGNTAENRNALQAAMAQLVAAKAIPERTTSKGEIIPATLSVHDETDLILYYLGNIYEDLPLVYGGFDRVLTRKLAQGYNPLALPLKLRFSSWGSSGDKDGNSQVTAGTTLEAVIMHQHEIIRRYVEDLAALPQVPEKGKLAAWHTRLTHVEIRLAELRRKIRSALAPIATINAETLRLEAMLGEEGRDEQLVTLRAAMRKKRLAHFSPEVFRRFSAELQDCIWTLGEYPKQHFLAELKIAYENTQGAEREAVLLLIRRVRCFGFQFARIEFRETAVEYTRVVSEILATYRRQCPTGAANVQLPATPYVNLSEPQKQELLTRLIASGMAHEILQQVIEDIEQRGAGLMYDRYDAAPITLHTLLRMELARDFPEMITANVLAECEDVSHLLEAQFLQAASMNTDGKRAIMGIVPLYEEPDVMEEVGDILACAYGNPTYRKHMALVAEHLFALGYGDGRPTQQVQIAHSDNTRRAGLPAARALIYQAHDLIREAGKRAGVTTQFFEGGSNSDPFRGGMRSISATANMYNTHDFLKFTFQGGDLLNYFNYPGSTERLFARNFSHMARTLLLKDKGTWNIGETEESDHPSNLRAWTEIALPALIATRQDYRDHIFSKQAIGRFLYETRDASGNTSSRAGVRSSGKAGREEQERSIDPVDMRTITFSESFAHAGITATWLGTLTLEESLRQALVHTAATRGAPMHAGFYSVQLQDSTYRIPAASGAPLETPILQDFYKKSAIFRDVADRIAFGVAMSDLEGLARYYPALAGDAFIEKRLHPEYQIASALLGRILAGESLPENTPSTHQLREHIRLLLPHLHGVMQHKGCYMQVAQEMKCAWRQQADTSGVRKHWVMSLAHAAIDCVTHGRMPTADDPMYRKMLLQKTAR